jgi:hypothetical protein
MNPKDKVKTIIDEDLFEQSFDNRFTEQTNDTNDLKQTPDEILDAYNHTFPDKEDKGEVDFSFSVTVDGIKKNITHPDDQKIIIGEIIEKDGKVIKYDICPVKLWIELMKIIYHRVNAAAGTSCLLNVRSISRQITREGNIDSITAVEREVIKIFRTKFGVKDVDPNTREYRGLKKLRKTITLWTTLGNKKKSRKRPVRIYQVQNGKKIMEYIEEELDGREEKE